MSKKNGVPYRKWLVPKSKYGIKCPNSMNPKKITLHNTDNQMPAENEISYMRNNNRQVSYHVAVDEKEAIQGLPFNRNGWHSGDGGNGYGNRNTVAIEICRNYDRSKNSTNLTEPLKTQYRKAEENAVKVVAQLAIDLGIPANNKNIRTHNDWNGKWCPRKILNEKRLQSVKNRIIKEYNRLQGEPSKPIKPDTTPKPKPTNPSGRISVDGYWEGETTRKLQQALGTPVDGIISRPSVVIKELQRLIGARIDGYRGPETYRRLQAYLGTPVDGKISRPSLMVKELQRRLNAGTLKSKGSQTKSFTQMVKEVRAGKHGNGHTKRRKSLGISKSEYEKVKKEVNRQERGGAAKTKTVKPGQTIRTRALYSSANSTKNVRKSSISGYVADINNSRRNPIRLRNKRGGYYLGFTRKEDLV